MIHYCSMRAQAKESEDSESENADPQKDEPKKTKRSPQKAASPEKPGADAESERQAAREQETRSPSAGPPLVQSPPGKGVGVGNAPPLVHMMLSVPFARGLEQSPVAAAVGAGSGGSSSSYFLSCKLFWLNDYLRSAPSRTATATDPLASHPEFFFLQAGNPNPFSSLSY